jgi:hypothetical protein
MGEWGNGPFDNDDADDLLQDVLDTDAAQAEQVLREALQGAAREGYIDAPADQRVARHLE